MSGFSSNLFFQITPDGAPLVQPPEQQATQRSQGGGRFPFVPQVARLQKVEGFLGNVDDSSVFGPPREGLQVTDGQFLFSDKDVVDTVPDLVFERPPLLPAHPPESLPSNTDLFNDYFNVYSDGQKKTPVVEVKDPEAIRLAMLQKLDEAQKTVVARGLPATEAMRELNQVVGEIAIADPQLGVVAQQNNEEFMNEEYPPAIRRVTRPTEDVRRDSLRRLEEASAKALTAQAEIELLMKEYESILEREGAVGSMQEVVEVRERKLAVEARILQLQSVVQHQGMIAQVAQGQPITIPEPVQEDAPRTEEVPLSDLAQVAMEDAQAKSESGSDGILRGAEAERQSILQAYVNDVYQPENAGRLEEMQAEGRAIIQSVMDAGAMDTKDARVMLIVGWMKTYPEAGIVGSVSDYLKPIKSVRNPERALQRLDVERITRFGDLADALPYSIPLAVGDVKMEGRQVASLRGTAERAEPRTGLAPRMDGGIGEGPSRPLPPIAEFKEMEEHKGGVQGKRRMIQGQKAPSRIRRRHALHRGELREYGEVEEHKGSVTATRRMIQGQRVTEAEAKSVIQVAGVIKDLIGEGPMKALPRIDMAREVVMADEVVMASEVVMAEVVDEDEKEMLQEATQLLTSMVSNQAQDSPVKNKVYDIIRANILRVLISSIQGSEEEKMMAQKTINKAQRDLRNLERENALIDTLAFKRRVISAWMASNPERALRLGVEGYVQATDYIDQADDVQDLVRALNQVGSRASDRRLMQSERQQRQGMPPLEQATPQRQRRYF